MTTSLLLFLKIRVFILFRHYFLLDGPAHFFENTFENLLLNSDYLRKNTDDKVAWEKFWRAFSKKTMLNFLTSGHPCTFFKIFFSKIDLRFDFSVQKYVWEGGMAKVLTCFSKVWTPYLLRMDFLAKRTFLYFVAWSYFISLQSVISQLRLLTTFLAPIFRLTYRYLTWVLPAWKFYW